MTNANTMSAEYGIAMGTKRGKCQEDGCKGCPRYRPADDVGEGGGPCLFCGHFPGNHENLGRCNESDKVIYDDPDPLGLLNEPGNQETEEDTEARKQLQDLCEWSIAGNELKFLEKLGSGRSAKVYKGLYKNEVVAIKVLKSTMEPKELRNFKGELDIMSQANSQHVVRFYGGCLQPKICLVMEYCSNGSLYHLLQRREFNFDWPLFFRVVIEMVEGVLALHSMEPPIVHRDLKSLNLLVNNNYQIKVCDFGLSRITQGSQDDSTLGKLRGTYAYSAPEVYKGDRYSTKSDVFSLGIILWECIARILTGDYQRPYKEYNFKIDFQIIINTAKHGHRPKIGMDVIPDTLKNLVVQCWSAKPEDRPEAREVLTTLVSIQHEYENNKVEWDAKINVLADKYGPNAPPQPGAGARKSQYGTNAVSNSAASTTNVNASKMLDKTTTQSQPVLKQDSIPTEGTKWSHKGIDDFLRTDKTTSRDPEKDNNRRSLTRSASKKLLSKMHAQQKTETDLKETAAATPAQETNNTSSAASEVKVEVATPWVRMGNWREEDAFDEEPKNKKSGGKLGKLVSNMFGSKSKKK